MAMMLFIFCEGCGIPLRAPARHCVRCLPKQSRRRLSVKKVAPRARRDQSR